MPDGPVTAPPLAGLTILDLTQIYNGPYATFLLAAGGAEVIKVEPFGGEHLRKRAETPASRLPYAMLNAGKRSLRLDIKSAAGRDILLRLADRADVVVENFAPGVMERLGFGAAVMQARNPRLIYACSSGYGATGPYRDYPAMDLTVQAMSGIMACTGYAEQPPVKAGPAICDFNTGVHLYAAIVTALFDRERTGRARRVEVSMMEAAYVTLSSSIGMVHASGGAAAARTGNRHGGMSLAPYNTYPASDGYVAILANNDTHWRALVTALGSPELAEDPRCATNPARVRNMDEVDAMVAALTRRLTRAEVFARMVAARVPAAPVRELSEVLSDPHLHARGMLREYEHPQYGPMTAMASALRFDGEVSLPGRPSVPLGADSRDVLTEKLGLTGAALEELERDRVI
jgi:formyl-CoA transferase